MSAAESLDVDRYAVGFVDGLARRPMADDTGHGRRRFTVRDLAEVLEQGRRLGRAEAGVDAEVIDLAERLSRRIGDDPGQPLTGPVRHLRLVEAVDG